MELRAVETVGEYVGTMKPGEDWRAELEAMYAATDVDESYAEFYGYEPEELPGKHWSDLHPEAEVEHIRAHVLPVVEDGGQWSGHSEGLRADGSTVTESKMVTSLEDGRLLIAVSELDDR